MSDSDLAERDTRRERYFQDISAEELRERVRFLESILRTRHIATSRGEACELALERGVGCCNPDCDGNWGTGCWCCHAVSYAASASLGDIRSHLALLHKPRGFDALKAKTEAAIRKAAEREQRASSAHMEVSRLHEELAALVPATAPEGRRARLRVVVSSLDAAGTATFARESAYARAAERARHYLAEEGISDDARRDLTALAEEAETLLRKLPGST